MAGPADGAVALDQEKTPEGEPDFTLNLGTTSTVLYLEFDVVDYRGASMTLESIPLYDETVFVWEMVR